MIAVRQVGERVHCSSFILPTGAEEFWFYATSVSDSSFTESIALLEREYFAALEACGLGAGSVVFSRYYLSDIANQKDDLARSGIFSFGKAGAYSVIQQCPLTGGAIGLFTYHLRSPGPAYAKKTMVFDDEHWRNGVQLEGRHYGLFWSGNFSGYGELDSFQQTNEIFSSYNAFINDNGMTLLRNTVRTWIYVRDIDNHYQGMADSRRNYFDEQGLTRETRYIASTGIEAKLKEVYSLVSLDALSVAGLRSEQIVRMEALDHLCPTHAYGVTFERGAKIVYGDRAHLYISGTASIDRNGEVLHVSDVAKQTERTLENITALLAPHGASLTDMAYFIVYMRNITEAKKVLAIMNARFGRDVPVIMVEGSVCRPKWLVEIEGMAVVPQDAPYPAFL